MSKKFTVYLEDEQAERLEAETTRQASPGKVIKNRLQAAWHAEDTAPVLPKTVPTDSVFTKGGDEIKRHVSDNDISALSESTAKLVETPPSYFFSANHAKVLMTIGCKKEQRKRSFVRSEIVKEAKVTGHIVDEVLKTLLAEGRIKKIDYNTYEWA